MPEPAIAVDRLTKQFGGLRAVDGVSLRVEAGERRALIGPNGAGKTTLFHCITGTMPCSSGTISLFGRDVTRLKENARTALGMGRTFQISNLFDELSVRENLALALLGKSRRKWLMHHPVDELPDLDHRLEERLAAAALHDRAGEPVHTLSHGERRRLELALALGTDPRVLLLDEPCAGLSPSERQDFSRLIAALPRAVTMVLIEHDMDIALGLADRVTVLHNGAVIFEGSPAAVQRNPQVREVYFGKV
ncbi:MAG: ABC transporter ATP-binding protein [Geminicoccaceae bacterium]